MSENSDTQPDDDGSEEEYITRKEAERLVDKRVRELERCLEHFEGAFDR